VLQWKPPEIEHFTELHPVQELEDYQIVIIHKQIGVCKCVGLCV